VIAQLWLLVQAGCTAPPSVGRAINVNDPTFLHRSVKRVTDVIVHDIFSPPVASRIYVYMSIAAYEAALHHTEDYVSLAGQVNGLEPVPAPDPDAEYCFPLASVEAALTVGTALIFSEDRMHEFRADIL